MHILNKKKSLFLLMGDIFFLIFSLWVTLLIRYLQLPGQDLFFRHLFPFSFIFVIWVVSFFIVGLYEDQSSILKSRLSHSIWNTQIFNSLIAIVFFYLTPYFNITPKTILFIYLIISSAFQIFWRIYLFSLFSSKKKQNVLLLAQGREMESLKNEVNINGHYSFRFVAPIDLDQSISDLQTQVIERVHKDAVSFIVLDLHDKKVKPILPHLYNLIFSKVVFMEVYKLYEDIFKRVPLSILKYEWFLENISLAPRVVYDFMKRLMDIGLGIILGLVTLPFYPLVFLLVKIEDGGPLFIVQKRVGQDNNPLKLIKFRTMTSNDEGEYSRGIQNKVTRVGSFLRKTRIDEFPQFWNIVKGDLSFVGPRPELPEPVKKYEQEIPYYNIRHLIKPGLSGWAQIYHDEHPHHEIAIQQTKDKLSYDLYYVKNRSFFLDLKIALKTLKVLLARKGR